MNMNSDEGIELRLNRTLTRFYEGFADWEDCVAQQVGLTPRQVHAVAELGKMGPVRMKPLAQSLGITTGTLTILADRLEHAGLIERRPDPQDGRATTICLTEAGRGVCQKHDEHHGNLSREFLSVLDPKEAEVLVGLLAKLTSLL